jgi:hypothetical protein
MVWCFDLILWINRIIGLNEMYCTIKSVILHTICKCMSIKLYKYTVKLQDLASFIF